VESCEGHGGGSGEVPAVGVGGELNCEEEH
jgi:hypothetical protein